jgi:Protein of unknown function (DUF4058)
MAGPFRGMDPYVESQTAWPDSHRGTYPINKLGSGRQAYLDMRDKLHDPRVNLVEIDLLLGGAPLPMKERIEPGAYYAFVARGARLPLAEVYRWTVRDPLPRIPIPLREPDPDVPIDLAALVTRVYDLGR